MSSFQSKIIKIKRWGVFILFAVLIMACKDKNANQIPTGKAVKGTFFVDLYEEGVLEAVNSVNIASPSVPMRFGTSMKIAFIVKEIGRAHV